LDIHNCENVQTFYDHLELTFRVEETERSKRFFVYFLKTGAFSFSRKKEHFRGKFLCQRKNDPTNNFFLRKWKTAFFSDDSFKMEKG
jgi:hypothetical protein